MIYPILPFTSISLRELVLRVRLLVCRARLFTFRPSAAVCWFAPMPHGLNFWFMFNSFLFRSCRACLFSASLIKFPVLHTVLLCHGLFAYYWVLQYICRCKFF